MTIQNIISAFDSTIGVDCWVSPQYYIASTQRVRIYDIVGGIVSEYDGGMSLINAISDNRKDSALAYVKPVDLAYLKMEL